MTEFWVSSGHHLTTRSGGGGLVVSDELILAYLARPELTPPPDACAAERALHMKLMDAPRRLVTPAEIAAIEDPDARQNWDLMIAFRDRLLAAPTVEAAYLSLIRNGVGQTPPLFINQLVHLILRNALDGCTDAYMLRAAELPPFFSVPGCALPDLVRKAYPASVKMLRISAAATHCHFGVDRKSTRLNSSH